MMKKYFNDGLLQLAIVLSLLRIDLQDYLNVQYYQDIGGLLQGPMTAVPQTRFSHNWNRRGGYIHPKHIDNDNIFSDIHDLGLRHVNNINIDAYLVSNPQVTLPSESASTSNEQNNTQSDSNNNQPSGGNGTASTASGPSSGTSENQDDQKKEEPPLPVGAELTKEDMDLIEVLWRQDIDLGVGREMFDVNLRRELEKEKELELHKKQAQESAKAALAPPAAATESQPQSHAALNFTVDSETGELIPQPQAAPPAPEEPAQPLPQQQQQLQAEPVIDLDVNEAIQFLASQVENIAAAAADQVSPQQAANYHQQQMSVSRQNSFEERWADVANLLDITPDGPIIHVDVNDTNDNNPLLQNATLASVAAPPQANHTEFMPAQASNQGIGESGNVYHPFHNASLQQSPVAPLDSANSTLFNMDTQGLIFNNNTGAPLDPLAAPAAPVANTSSGFSNTTNNSYTNDTFSNQTFNNQTFNNQTLLEMLDDENLDKIDIDIMDINQTEDDAMPVNDASSDSAVGSMAGSASPLMQNLTDSMSNVSSTYDQMEGATGGHDNYDPMDFDPPPKFEPKPEMYGDQGYGSYGASASKSYYDDDNMHVNESEANSNPDYSYNDIANPRHVKHNHSYPLQPGQTPREKKLTAEQKRAAAQLSRDEKKAKALKVPFTMEEIINTPVEEFNDMITQHKLTEQQMQLIKDIRRRGKNKVAAQNCRKRKMEIITGLEDDVDSIRHERDRLVRERTQLRKRADDMKHKFNNMYQEVFRSLRDDNGHPYDPNHFSLQQTPDGNVFIVPINHTSPATQDRHTATGGSDPSKPGKRKGRKGAR